MTSVFVSTGEAFTAQGANDVVGRTRNELPLDGVGTPRRMEGREAARSSRRMDPPVVPGAFFDALAAANQAWWDGTLSQLDRDFTALVESLTPPARAQIRAIPERMPGPTPTAGGGSLSVSQLAALAQCENGGANGWRTGYFGIESPGEGNKSYGEQVADANRIYAESGARAWGCGGVL